MRHTLFQSMEQMIHHAMTDMIHRLSNVTYAVSVERTVGISASADDSIRLMQARRNGTRLATVSAKRSQQRSRQNSHRWCSGALERHPEVSNVGALWRDECQQMQATIPLPARLKPARRMTRSDGCNQSEIK